MTKKNKWETTGRVAMARMWCDECQKTTTWTFVALSDTKEKATCRCGNSKEYQTR